MTLLIDKNTLANSIGYLNIYIGSIQNMLKILNNTGAKQDEIINAEKIINEEIQKFNKMINVIISKGKFTPSILKYTDTELSNMGII